MSILILFSILLNHGSLNAFGSSPSFSLQGIYDYRDDWTLESKYSNTSNASECDAINSTSSFSDIAAVEYYSDGSLLNTRIWFTAPFKEPQDLDNLLSTYGILPLQRIYSLYVDIDSSYDIGEVYQLRISWDSKEKTWKKMLWELPPPTGTFIKPKVSNVVENFTDFYEKNHNYLDLSLNLSHITLPERYTVLVYATEVFRTKDLVFCTVRDVTNALYMPPPEFTISNTPSSISLRPGDQRFMEIQIRNNNTPFNSDVLLSISNNTPGIEIEITPNRTSIPPKGIVTALLSIKAENSVSPRPYTLSLDTDIILKTNLSNILGNLRMDDTRPAFISKTYDFTLNVMEPLSINDHMIQMLDNWIDPLTGTYATIVTIITGILGWKIWHKQRK